MAALVIVSGTTCLISRFNSSETTRLFFFSFPARVHLAVERVGGPPIEPAKSAPGAASHSPRPFDRFSLIPCFHSASWARPFSNENWKICLDREGEPDVTLQYGM